MRCFCSACVRSSAALDACLRFALPWLAGCAQVAIGWRRVAIEHIELVPTELFAYWFNFLGAGIARFATDLAPWLGGGGLALLLMLAPRAQREPPQRPWLALSLVGALAGALIAAGRAGPFGPEQAFVNRYVSFSSLFWLGLAGMLTARARAQAGRATATALGVIALFASANALHLVHKARLLGASTRATAASIRASWPAVDPILLGKIYFGRPQLAKERLDWLHAHRYPPFDRSSAAERPRSPSSSP